MLPDERKNGLREKRHNSVKCHDSRSDPYSLLAIRQLLCVITTLSIRRRTSVDPPDTENLLRYSTAPQKLAEFPRGVSTRC